MSVIKVKAIPPNLPGYVKTVYWQVIPCPTWRQEHQWQPHNRHKYPDV